MTDQYPQNNPYQPQPVAPQPMSQGDPATHQFVAPTPAPAPPVQADPQPTPLDPEALRRRRNKRAEGFPFTLFDTTDEYGNPTTIRAKLPQIFDAGTLADLPADLRRSIFELVEATEDKEGKETDEERDVNKMSTRQLAEEFGSLAQIVDAYCITGFVEPRCYATVEEADNNAGVWVKDIEFTDRMRFFEHCTSKERRAVADVTPFPDGRPVAPVGTGSADPTVPGADQPVSGAEAQPATPTPGY